MRKKLRLELDAVSVDSFATSDAMDARRGTVEAQAPCTCWRSCVEMPIASFMPTMPHATSSGMSVWPR